MARTIPPTETPFAVYITAIIFFILPLLILINIFGFLIGLAINLVLFGIMSSMFIADTIAPFHAIIVVNSFTGAMRTLFPGLNLKMPWEREERGDDEKKNYIDLKAELGEPCDETYQAQDGEMLVKYIYAIKADASFDYQDSPGEKIIKFDSFEKNFIKSKGRALISSIISDYYGKNIQKDLLDKVVITNAVKSKNKSELDKFEEEYGAKISFKVEDSDLNEETKKAKDMISKAKSFIEAVKILTDQGMDKARAEKNIRLMLGVNYKEEDLNLNVSAPDLKNLQNVSILGRGGKS